MLYDRDIEPNCAYCRHSSTLGADEVVCVRRGIMSGTGSCGAFSYEPTKRAPGAICKLKPTELTEEDFTI